MDPAQAVTASRIESWFDARGRASRWGLAFLSGMLATLGHAPFQIVPAFVVAIVILMWLLDAIGRRRLSLLRRVLAGAATAYAFGLGHFLTGFYWVSSAFLVDANTFGALAIPAVLGLGGGLAIFWALGGALALAIWTPDMRRVAGFAVVAFVCEWLRGHLFGGLPWLLPGYVWMPGEPISQLASLVGIYGLTLLTLLISAAFATIADGRYRGGLRFAPTILAALALGLAWGWGAQRVARAPADAPGALPIVRVADSGLSQREKWADHPDQEYRVLARYLRATGTQEESHAQIVVWPEGAIPTINFYTLENPDFLDHIAAGLGDRVLVLGLSRRALVNGQVAYFNSAIAIDAVAGRPRIDMTQVYDKNRLVPFGEFIPLWSVFSRFNIAPLQEIGAGFTPGPPPTRRVIPEAPPAVILICYEAIFPDLTPRGEDRPGWIIAVSNDAWFGHGTGPYQHYVAARYRSIEEGLPMARAASGGVSAIIDSFGRAVRETDRPGGAVEAQLPPALPETAYAAWGFLLIPGLVVLVLALRFVPIDTSMRGKR
ncbi:MAG: apolipoprotein N-acyltransferase [Pseudomonadota bacterium]